ncbi:protein kinase domain-containing protein [Sorangium sp. So ce233]|uniref:serine/threonine-protein kinase n=1 Tax=Sorangium sp. So ce233 TaxID=3133290 RepID=UPI003F5F208B
MPERPPEPPLTSDEAAKQRAASYLGRVISRRYRIDEVIAMGGMGAVYRGEHVHMHKRVAIKILHPDTERLPELVERFEREAIAGAHIQHRNVATATDFGEAEDGSFFLVLEYVRGTTLHEIIRRGAMPAPRAVLIARQLAAALDATHAMNIVHRDLKPRNVMVVEPQGDLVKLIDFGLAKVSVDELRRSAASPESVRAPESLPARLTTAGVIFGTIAYLAPESALGMDFVDGRSDLYALGLIFYEMLAGKHPFLAKDPVELFNQQRSAPVPAIAEHSPGVVVPPAIEAIVRRLLEKQPRARFETAAELLAALDQACAASGIVTQEPRAEMSSRAEMTSVPAIGDAARVPSNRPPLPSSAPSREPEPSPGSASAIVLGESCLVSLNEVAGELESAAQRSAGEPAGSGAGAPEPERAGAPAEGGAGEPAEGGAGEPAEGGAGEPAAAEGPADDDAEEAPASFSRPTPVRDTPSLVAELTRDSRPTAVGGAAFMAQVAFAREEAAAGDGASGGDDATLSSDSRPTAVGGAAFMAQVAFAREEAASRAARTEAGDAQPSPEPSPEPSRPPAEPARSQEPPASQEPAPQEPAPPGAPAPALEASPAQSLEEALSKEPPGPISARLPLEERAPSSEAPERPAERSSKKPSLPGAEEPSRAPSAAGPASARPTSLSGAGPSSARSSSPSGAGPSSARPPSASAAEPSSARSSSPSAAGQSSARSSSPSAAGQSSARSSSPSAAEPSSARSSSPSAAGAVSSRSPAPSATPVSSKPPASAAAEPLARPPSPSAAGPVSSKPPAAAAENAPSKPPAAAAAPAPSQPPASPAAAPAPSPPPAPSDKAQPSQVEPPSAAPASPSQGEPPADDAEPASERLSGSRPAFAPTLLRELEAAEAERVAREREEEATRKLAEEAERAAREREEKARRKLAAREARAAQRSDAEPGARLRRIAPYLAGALITAGVIAALAGGGRAPPEPDPQLGQANPPASAPATSEPAPPDPAAAESPGPTAPAPDPAATAAPDTPAEPPPDEAGRKALADAARARRWVKAAEALNALAERDPTALRDRALAIAARNVAIAISKTGGELADKVFDALASRFGTAGLDVLYEIVETRGRSTPANRAAKLLRDPEIAARGTPAVRIAFELRDATCGEKLPFLDRAVSEGDQRTLVVLETAVRPCYTKNRAIDEAIKKLRARLEGG